ncbi:MAG: hypothetical protein EP330_15630 [Deltaproteobacteria bacterium]|nr:MAG: hypothetical protein EP330_15630 [Deltaproteobacteria bacterium]
MDPEHLVSEGAGRAQVTPTALLTAFVCFGLGASVSLAALQTTPADVDAREIEVYGEKLALLRTCPGPYDLVVVGNSRAYRAVASPMLETALAERGEPARVLNLAAPSLLESELHLLVDALAACPQPPGRVLIDPDLALYDLDNWSGERRMFGQTWDRAGHWSARSVELVGVGSAGLRTRAEAAGGAVSHLGTAAARSGRFGRGARWVFPEVPGAIPEYATPPAHGWLPLEDELSDLGIRRRKRFVEQQEDFLADVARPVGEDDEHLLPEERADLERLVATIRGMGAEPVWLLTPASTVPRRRRALRNDLPGLGAPLLDYTRGETNADLYALELWHDRSHLNQHGAEHFATVLADDLVAL